MALTPLLGAGIPGCACTAWDGHLALLVLSGIAAVAEPAGEAAGAAAANPDI